MGKFNLFENASENDIEIERNTIKINENILTGPFIQKYFGKKSVFDQDQKKTVLLHFLKTGDFIDEIIPGRSDGEYKIISNLLFKNIHVNHDPSKGNSLLIACDFGSLLNLHGHALKHCIHDYWLNGPYQPSFIPPKKSFFNEFWKEFRTTKCQFWAQYETSDFDTPESARLIFDSNRFQKIDTKINQIRRYTDLFQLGQLVNNFDQKSVCMECINQHKGVDSFLNCWDVASKFGIHKTYITKIKDWIAIAVKDKKNYSFYSGENQNGSPRRLHVHSTKNGNNYLYAYAIQSSENKDDIFTLIFKNSRKGNPSFYRISTAYAFKKATKPIPVIKRKLSKLNIEHYCHERNWK